MVIIFVIFGSNEGHTLSKFSLMMQNNFISQFIFFLHKDNFFPKQTGQHQTKMVLHSEGSHQQTEGPPPQWENISAHDTANKGLKSKLYKEFNTKTAPK